MGVLEIDFADKLPPLPGGREILANIVVGGVAQHVPFPVLSPFGPTGRQGGEGWGTPAVLPSLNSWSTVVCFPAFSSGTQFGF